MRSFGRRAADRRVLSRVFSCTLLAVAITAPASAPRAAEDAIANRIASVTTLVERSSAAQRIAESGVVEAVSGRDAARELLVEARAAAAAGDPGRASQLLTRASATFVAATRAAEAGPGAAARADESLGAFIDSAGSMAGAARRVATERGDLGRLGKALDAIDALVADARRERSAGRPEAAREAARRAYLSARVFVVEMRQGATLVRSLDFASPADEYRYELDRHDAHRMILEMVRAERQLDASTTELVQRALDTGATARARAEHLAAGGDARAAIAELDAATRGLLAAIRRAGLYVPG